MVDARVGTADHTSHGKGLGAFIRSLVGLDREAAKQAFIQFLSGGTATITTYTSTNIVGTFSFTTSEKHTVTGGKFNITYTR